MYGPHLTRIMPSHPHFLSSSARSLARLEAPPRVLELGWAVWACFLVSDGQVFSRSHYHSELVPTTITNPLSRIIQLLTHTTFALLNHKTKEHTGAYTRLCTT